MRAREAVSHCKHLCGAAAGSRCPGPGSPRINLPTARCGSRANLRGPPAARGKPLTRIRDMRAAVRATREPAGAHRRRRWARRRRRAGFGVKGGGVSLRIGSKSRPIVGALAALRLPRALSRASCCRHLQARRTALSSVENVELETDTRRFHKEMYFLLTINNHFQVGADILEAVQFMHRMGVVHQVGVVRK